MSKYKTDDIRTVALVGHRAAGKTSLADALLFQAKAVDRKGSVDDGTSFSDYDEEEKKRQCSIYTSVFHLEHNTHEIHLLDAPGYPDFVGAALGALEAVENAAIVIAANSGIQVNTRRMFKEAGKRDLARMIVLNKLDADNINFEQLLANVRETFGNNCVLFNAPNGLGKNCTEVISVLSPPDKIPEGCPVDLESERSALVDAVVESDEALMEKYLEEGAVSTEELNAALPTAIASGSCIPIFCTSATHDVGISELLEAFSSFTLSPKQGRKRKVSGDNGQDTKELEPSEDGPFLAQVFKTINDKFVGNLSFMRVYSGKITGHQNIVIGRTGKSTRHTGLMAVQGKNQEPVEEAVPGDIVAVAKVDDLHIGDTVSIEAGTGTISNLSFPTPLFGLAIEPKSRGDEQKISGSLAKIAEEDPTFVVNRDAATKEMVVVGMSQLHLDVIQSQLKRRYDLEVETHEPKIAYRETIQSDGGADYLHKKQSGGSGQFAKVFLRIYPLRHIESEEQFHEEFATKAKFEKLRSASYDPSCNFGFLDTIVGGTIPNQFVPAVEKGCRELMERGAVAGYQMQDIAVEVYEGKAHSVDSNETAFKTAARHAFKKAVQQAVPALLEPVVDLEVTVPADKTGDILSLLNTKRAHIEDQESLPGDLFVLKAKAPLAKVTRLSAELGSLTGGQATYSMEFSHYEIVPPDEMRKIVEKAQHQDEEED